MALGNVCMTKQRKEMGVQTLQYVFFLEKQNKTETGTKAKRKIQNNETKPRVDNYYGKVTRTFCYSLRCKRRMENSQRAP